MFLDSVLETFQSTLSGSHLLSEYPILLTPDERPFPNNGERSVSMFGSEFVRVSKTDNRLFQTVIKLSVNTRITFTPRDRAYHRLYLDSLISLSTTCDIIVSILDTNSSILSSINTSVNTKIQEITDNLNDSRIPTVSELNYLNMLGGATVLGPIRVIGYTAQPIPRFADFFTAYNENRDVSFQGGNARITESGYSMVITVQGPQIALPILC